MNERSAAVLFLLLALILPVSALVARGVPRGRTLRMALLWVAIFAVAAVAAGLLQGRLQARTLHNIYYQTDGGS